jgi:PAS domain S-box-containing protein
VSAGSAWPVSPPEFLDWLEHNAQDILAEWVERLGVLSPNYRQRPQEELCFTVGRAFAANLAALARGELAPIDAFIEFITAKRLHAGFPLSDVQMAFELFRIVVTRRLREEGRLELMGDAQEAVNACLSHTIHRFSDLFQSMHDQVIRRHAQQLEEQVQKRTAELAESERRYKTLVNEINDGYFMIQEGFIIFANQAFCRMHGAGLYQVLGQPFLNFVNRADRVKVREAYQAIVAGQPMLTQLEYRRGGCPEDQASTEIKARLVDLGQGPVTIGICRDISARVAMEAAVREHERLAYVGHLTASLSHEIRNPLSAIKMNMQILARKLSLDGYDLRRLQITVREITRLEDILRQLLDTARPLQLRTGPVDLAALARGCLEVLEPKTQEKRLRVAQRHPPAPPLAQADAGRLEQALMNLLLNAIEASPPEGEVLVWTDLGQEEGRAYAELGVRDSGAGVDPQHLPHVFTPFFTSKASGTGLGLSNVKRIVEAHGGRVMVGGWPGGGAVFSMRLPCPP